MATTFKVFHMACSPRLLLMLKQEGKTWDEILRKRPKGASDADIEAQVRKDLADGILYPLSGKKCEGWDDHKGCPGHVGRQRAAR